MRSATLSSNPKSIAIDLGEKAREIDLGALELALQEGDSLSEGLWGVTSGGMSGENNLALFTINPALSFYQCWSF